MSSNDTLDNKCPSCGANIKFNPKSQRWDCEYCGSSFDVSAFKNEENEYIEHWEQYTCKNCGAIVICDINTTATECVYCGNTTIIKDRLQGEFKPDKIIPFKTVKEDAIESFKKIVKKKCFAPKTFSNKENIEKITGIYIPFWLFDGNVFAEFNIDGKKSHSWRSGDYIYTETETYDVVRSGEEIFIDVPVDGSTKFNDIIMDSIEPYEYGDFKEFNKSYLAGFLAERYDQRSDDVYSRAKERIENTISEEIMKTVTGSSSISVKNSKINIAKGRPEYALLPVWMLNVKYNEEYYTFAMNGQTGKCVGNIPIDVDQVMRKSTIFFVICEILTFIFCYVIGGAL